MALPLKLELPLHLRSIREEAVKRPTQANTGRFGALVDFVVENRLWRQQARVARLEFDMRYSIS
jgi:hypothetical protein